MIRFVVPPRRRDPRGEIGLASGQLLVVVSPHLDDAAFSVGSTLAEATIGGIAVTNLTVFAGDPASKAPPSLWDRKAGFSSAGAAARSRRAEDAAACALIGMTPIWLSYPDSHYPGDRSGVWPEMEPVLKRADLILIPGFPLVHDDHAWVNNIVRGHARELPPLALYVEQPYAEMEWFGMHSLPGDDTFEPSAGAPVRWVRLRASTRAWLRKQRACRAYRSQLRAFTRPGDRLLARIALYELGRGGECLGFTDGVPKR